MALATIGLKFLGAPWYRGYKERRSARRAEQYLAKADVRNAALCARQALAYNGSNIVACRIMARLAETVGAAQAVEWRRRVVAAEPSIENRLQLAAAALRLEPAPWQLAQETLEGLATQASNRVWFQSLSAELALKLDRKSEAESHFAEAARLEPGNAWHQLNLAVLRLSSTNDTVSADARTALEALAGDSKAGPAALRWLIQDRLQHQDAASAQLYAARLAASPHGTVEDHLRHLALLRQAGSTNFDAALNHTQDLAATNAMAAQAVAAWMRGNGLTAEALRWLTNLRAPIVRQPPVRLAVSDCLAAGKNWNGLAHYLNHDKWEDAEFLRLGLLSNAEEQLGENSAAEGHWRLAVHAAGDRPDALRALTELARDKTRGREREDLLWAVCQKYPRQQWAWGELDRIYAAAGDTRALHKLYSTLASSSATDPAACNNFAATSMLLKTNLEQAFQAAEQVHRTNPDNPVYTATYAYSLHLQGRTQAGVAVLEKLRPDTLRTGPISLYYAVLLCADGQQSKASALPPEARQGNWLPEEKELWQSVNRTVSGN